jgi:hypothetical protein
MAISTRLLPPAVLVTASVLSLLLAGCNQKPNKAPAAADPAAAPTGSAPAPAAGEHESEGDSRTEGPPGRQ